MPYLEPVGPGKWRLEVSLGFDPVTGKRIRKKKTFKAKTEEEANEKATEIEAKIRRGTLLDPDKASVADWLLYWIDHYQVNLKITTAHSYRSIITRRIIPVLGHIKLKDLTALHIDQYIKQKFDIGNSKRTVQYDIVILRLALRDAIDKGLLSANPADKVRVPKINKSDRRAKGKPLKYDDAKLLLAGLEGHKDREAIIFEILAGYRRGELLGLGWDDIDWEWSLAKVTRTVISNPEKGGGILFGTPKTEESGEPIELTDTMIAILKSVKRQQAKYKMQYGPDYKDYGLVFCNPDGTPINPYTFSGRFRTLTRKLGLNVSIKDLRHTMATLLIKEGASLKVVQSRTRHTTIKTTGDNYIEVSPSQQKAPLEKVEQKLGLYKHPRSSSAN